MGVLPHEAVIWLVAGMGWGLFVACFAGVCIVMVFMRSRMAAEPARRPPAPASRPADDIGQPKPARRARVLFVLSRQPARTAPVQPVVGLPAATPMLALPAPRDGDAVVCAPKPGKPPRPMFEALPRVPEPLDRRRRVLKWWPADKGGWVDRSEKAPAMDLLPPEPPAAGQGRAVAPEAVVTRFIVYDGPEAGLEGELAEIERVGLPSGSVDHWDWLGLGL